MKYIKRLLFILFLTLTFCSKVTAESIEKVWEKDFNTTNWNHIDLFDYTKKMEDYQYHLRGFKELEDSYVMVLKSSDTTDELLKISKSGELIKEVSLQTRTATSSNYYMHKDYILSARIILGDNIFNIRLEKYNYNLELIDFKEYPLTTTYNLIRHFFHNDTIVTLMISNNNLSIKKYNYNFEEIDSKENIKEISYVNGMFNDSIITIGTQTNSILYDVIKDEIFESTTTDYQTYYHQYVAEHYPGFYGNNKDIGDDFYYLKNGETYDVYTLDNKLITSDANRYFYDLHGKLAVATDYQNNNFNIYNINGEKEMNCNMFVITTDGFLVLTKLADETGSVTKTKIEKYQIKYKLDNEEEQANGKINITDGEYTVNEKIIVEVEPDDGYELDELIINDNKGNKIPYEEINKKEYSFIMPDSDVSVKANYKKIESVILENKVPDNPKTGWHNIVKDILILSLISIILIKINKKTYIKNI